MIETYIIGKRYRVPIVRGYINWKWAEWPVLGPKHEDRDYIGFEPEHYHLDARFLSNRLLRVVEDTRRGENGVFAIVIHDDDWAREAKKEPPMVHLGYKWRECRRHWPEYPRQLRWVAELSKAYSDHKLTKAMICPHRGASLAGLELKAGCVTCPLHGLMWNVATGRCVQPIGDKA